MRTINGVTLEQLRVIIEVQMGQYTQAMQSVQRQTMATTTIVRRQTDLIRGCLLKIGGILGTAFSAYALVSLGRKCIEVSSNLTEVQNVVDVTFGNMAYKVEEFAQTSIEKFGMSELTLKKTASQFQAIGTSMNISSDTMSKATEYLNKQTNGYVEMSDSMSDVSLTLTKLTADMASFYNMEQDAVAQDLRSIFTGMVVPMYQYGIDLTETNLKQWALTEGLNANIKSMTQAEKAMLRYQYVLAHTGAAQGDFERTANSWANQTRILKQNFEELGQVIGDSLIAALKPLVKALNEAMAHVIKFARVLSDSLGKIFGWEFDVGSGGITGDMEGAEDAAGGIGEGLSGAADKGKKLKQQLQGFDELNVISSGKDKESSSGGTGTGTADNGQWTQTESILDNCQSKLDSLFKLGEHIGKTITDALNSIDWESVYEGARSFGTGLAQFLNGIISPELFAAVGQTIAGSLNAAVYQALAFAQEFDWTDFGNSLAAGVNKFFETFDFKALAESINAWIKGAIAYATEFLKRTDFEAIGKKMGEFLVNLDFTEILGDLAKLLWEAIEAGFKLITGIFEEAPLETALIGAFAILKFTGLGSFIASKIVAALAAKLGLTGTFTSVGSVMVTALSGAITSALAAMGGIGNLLMLDATALAGTAGAASLGMVVATGVIGGIAAALSGWHFGQFLYEKFSKESIEMSWEEQFGEIFKSFTDGTWTDALTLWGEDVYDAFVQIGEDQQKWATDTYNAISEIISEWWENDVSPWFTREKWSELWNNVRHAATKMWNGLVNWWSNTALAKWWTQHVKPWFTKEKWVNAMTGIKEAFSTTWNSAIASIKEIWNTFANWLNDKLTWTIDPVEIMGKVVFEGTTISLGKIPTFATGGFPEDGLFMANHNELVGKFSNGRTAVANNEQITKGIADAIYPAVYNAVASAIRNNSNGSSAQSQTIKVFVGDRELTDIAIEGINERIRTTGRIPICI